MADSKQQLGPTVFQAGGTVRDEAVYIRRAADTVLFESLLRGEFCYVLGPRQIGKSSLRLRTQQRLQEHGVQCLHVDLSSLGSTGLTEDQWFYGLAWSLARQLGRSIEFKDFAKGYEGLGPVQRWSRFLREGLLAWTDKPLVISISCGLQQRHCADLRRHGRGLLHSGLPDRPLLPGVGYARVERHQERLYPLP
jgi:hypothetical protein